MIHKYEKEWSGALKGRQRIKSRMSWKYLEATLPLFASYPLHILVFIPLGWFFCYSTLGKLFRITVKIVNNSRPLSRTLDNFMSILFEYYTAKIECQILLFYICKIHIFLYYCLNSSNEFYLHIKIYRSIVLWYLNLIYAIPLKGISYLWKKFL